MSEIIKCMSCGKEFSVPFLSQEDKKNGEELPDICQDCPADPEMYR